MAHDSAVTVRIPAALKRGLEARARAARRSVSAQVLHDLEAAGDAATGAPGRFLGLFSGGKVPSDAEIHEVRSQLWGRLRTPRAT